MYRKNMEGWKKHTDFLFLDALILQISLILAWVLQEGKEFYLDPIYRGSVLLLIGSGFMLAVFFENLKDIRRRNFIAECGAALVFSFQCALCLVIYILLAGGKARVFRSIFLPFWGICFLLLVIERSMWKARLLRAGTKQENLKKVLIVTRKDKAEEIIFEIRDNAFSEIEIEGIILTDTDAMAGKNIRGAQVVSTMGDIISYIQTKWIDEVMVYLPDEKLPEDLLDKFFLMGITVHRVIDIRQDDQGRLETVEKMAGMTCITQSLYIASLGEMILKRSLDIAGGIVGMMFTVLLTIFVGPAIYFTDPGPIFFSQKRVGKNGRIFKIYKFRSMYRDAEQRKAELMAKNNIKEGLMFKMDNDPRILGSGPDGTKKGVGWFIRKTSIDEFPQFWSVLKGDMSIVGTRPPTLDEWEKYELHHRARLAVRPGLTGMWQVSGRSKIHDFEEVVRLDLTYINNWSIWEDFWIILKTVLVIFTGDGAE